ncbi:hypothetical protein HAX54_028377 [Datura stramonium]|uniref:Uncharacterized protein n=1 Tax=Datura stramonium TaxID=4076 RepID=A0ABS8V7A8_DATST|nr:hypothetical protein [Datura stramonium]
MEIVEEAELLGLFIRRAYSMEKSVCNREQGSEDTDVTMEEELVPVNGLQLASETGSHSCSFKFKYLKRRKGPGWSYTEINKCMFKQTSEITQLNRLYVAFVLPIFIISPSL